MPEKCKGLHRLCQGLHLFISCFSFTTSILLFLVSFKIVYALIGLRTPAFDVQSSARSHRFSSEETKIGVCVWWHHSRGLFEDNIAVLIDFFMSYIIFFKLIKHTFFLRVSSSMWLWELATVSCWLSPASTSSSSQTHSAAWRRKRLVHANARDML